MKGIIFGLFTPKTLALLSANILYLLPVREQWVIAIRNEPWITVAEGAVLPILPKKTIHENPIGVNPR